MRWLIAAGWLVQLASFGVALARAGRRAAMPDEWGRELALRAGMVALVALAIVDPRPPAVPLHGLARALAIATFLAGQLLATWARATLGSAWGIGIAPHGAPVRRGPYRVVPHPIYAGNALAFLAQAAVLQTPAAIALAAVAALVIPAKAIRESRLLGR